MQSHTNFSSIKMYNKSLGIIMNLLFKNKKHTFIHFELPINANGITCAKYNMYYVVFIFQMTSKRRYNNQRT